jgi:hypothetical protein
MNYQFPAAAAQYKAAPSSQSILREGTNLGSERPRFDYIEERANSLCGELQDISARLGVFIDRLGAPQNPQDAKISAATPSQTSVAGRLEDAMTFAHTMLETIRYQISALERL